MKSRAVAGRARWVDYPAWPEAQEDFLGVSGFALFARGWLGAGDAKLLGAVGAFLGPNTGVSAFLYASAIGGIWALAWVRLTSPGGMRAPGHTIKGRPVPYGFAIAAGTVVSFAFPLFK